MANEQLTIQPNDARMTVIGKSWPDQASDSGGGEWDDTYNGTYSGPIPRTDLPTKIAVTTPPTKKEYSKTERIDFTGMVVTAYNDDGTVWTSEKYPDGTIPLNEIISTRFFSTDNGEKIKYKTVKCLVYAGGFTSTIVRSFEEDTFVGTHMYHVEYSGKVTSNITPYVQDSIVILFAEADSPKYSYFFMLCSKNKADVLGSLQTISDCAYYIERYKHTYDEKWDTTDKTSEDTFSLTDNLNRITRDNYRGISYQNGYIKKGKPIFWAAGQTKEYKSEIDQESGPYSTVYESAFSKSPNVSGLSQIQYNGYSATNTLFLDMAWEILYGDDYETLGTVTIYWPRPEDGKYLSTSLDLTIKDELTFGGN